MEGVDCNKCLWENICKLKNRIPGHCPIDEYVEVPHVDRCDSTG